MHGFLALIRTQQSVAHVTDFAAPANCSDVKIVAETWTLSMSSSSRDLTLLVSGKTVAGSANSSTQVRAIERVFPINAPSIYSFFERGVVQMMNANNLPNSTTSFYAGTNPERVFGLGSGTAVDMRVVSQSSTASRPTTIKQTRV